ncbi:hypothetical protein E2986_12773 [Frieseomelitta varia]|uniref:Uncharacterized protein n=1 Tax=Frieseomelitta varia TaxID=561572 RepID=A0A833RU96_9HYME|nr:hypothetical protein E2986_12773 [Frieseomelitta varia]
MTDVNSNKVTSESSRKSFEHAKKELRSIVARIEETATLSSRSVKLFRAQCLLRHGGSKLPRKHLWILLILAWILGQFLWNYMHTVRYDKIRVLWKASGDHRCNVQLDGDGSILVFLLQIVVRRRGCELPVLPLQNRIQKPSGRVRDECQSVVVGERDEAVVRRLVDDVEHPSWQAQIKGEKLWTLEPPRECHYACNALEVVVHPGEIIVLDTNRWYHQTTIVSEEMSITIGAEYD